MKFHDRYLELRKQLWKEFERLVRRGARFTIPIDVIYPKGVHPEGLSKNSEGESWFYAKGLLADSAYKLHEGVDFIVATNKVVFIDLNDCAHEITPDDLDLYWLSELLDSAGEAKHADDRPRFHVITNSEKP